MYEVSVVVPVYNVSKNVVVNIKSLLNQSLDKIEIIIVNDGSNDDTASVIDTLASDYSNIKSIHLPTNKGVHEARLEGIKRATAPWIGFMDADDFAKPKMFAKMLRIAEKEKGDIVVCSIDRVTQDRKFLHKKLAFKRDQLIDQDVFDKFCKFEFGEGMLWNKLYRRELLFRLTEIPEIHFAWRQDLNEDLILNIGLFSQTKKVYLLKDALYDYVVHDNSITTRTNKVDSFVEHFRAYALALNVYAKLNDNIAVKISEIYRLQLAHYGYLMKDLSILLNEKEKISEAVELINQSNPFALALLSTSPYPVGKKDMIKYLARSMFRKRSFN